MRISAAVALLGVLVLLACYPPPVTPGPAHHKGATRIVLVNKGDEAICDVRLRVLATDLEDLLVCRPGTGTTPKNGQSGVDKCIGTCLAPGESRAFSVQPREYMFSGFYEKKPAYFFTTAKVQAPLELWFAGPVRPPARSPSGLPVVSVLSDKQQPEKFISPATAPKGPCVPNGSAPGPDQECCSGLSCQRMDGKSQPICRDQCDP